MTKRRNPRQAVAKPPAPVIDANAANASSDYFLAGGMGLIAALIPWYFELPLNFNVTDREFNPLVFVPVVFAVIGLYALLNAIRNTLRVRKFGATTLQAGGANPGKRFEGLLRASRDLAPAGDYTVLLRCIRTYRVGGPIMGIAADKSTYKKSSNGSKGSSSRAVQCSRAPAFLRLCHPRRRAAVEWAADVRTPAWQCALDPDRHRTDAGRRLLRGFRGRHEAVGPLTCRH